MPYGVVCDKRDGSVYFTEAGSHRIRRLSTDGFVSTVAGHSHGGFHDGEGAQACLNFPMGLTMDLHGDLIVADSHNHVIRRVQLVPEGSGALQAAAGSDRGDIVVGRVTTIAGPPPHPVASRVSKTTRTWAFPWCMNLPTVVFKTDVLSCPGAHPQTCSSMHSRCVMAYTLGVSWHAL